MMMLLLLRLLLLMVRLLLLLLLLMLLSGGAIDFGNVECIVGGGLCPILVDLGVKVGLCEDGGGIEIAAVRVGL
uniref:Putative secreted peptide n=1 Tax=Anopheles braziliensis TaxID=58242 RepID=A0A2M3ZXT0_9DIPT